jgi:predicted enzyme related to lactoylglutathione lyase
MAEWEKQIGAINLIVGDLERSKTFYREVFGLPPLHDRGPADRDWGMRTITFADPGGYIWEIAQDLPGAPGS